MASNMSDMSESQRRLVKQRTSARQAAQQDAAGSARKHRRRKYGGRADLVLSPMRRPEWAVRVGRCGSGQGITTGMYMSLFDGRRAT